MSHGRQTSSAEDRLEEKKIKDSLKVSNYLEDVYEAIHSGAAPKVSVPNYREPSRAEIFAQIKAGKNPSMDSEAQGLSMDFSAVTASMSEEQIKTAMTDAHTERQDGQKTFSASGAASSIDNRPRFTVSRNQAMALKKYPTLIEFLGRPEGEKVARSIAGDMNVLMAELVAANSKEANNHAIVCKAEKQNLRQYFQGDDWICRVTASGPFRGDEAIYYSRDKDTACVLRRSEVKGQVNYTDISDQFNIIYEAEQGEFSAAAEEEGKTAEASAEQATSAEEGENNEIIADVEIDETTEVVEATG